MTASRQEHSALRVGIIGAGWVAGSRHIPSFLQLPRVEVVGIYDRHEARARALADRFGIARVARTRQELFDLGLDAISVATSPWSHADHAVAALDAGLHVFCEKPMALDSHDARQMVEASERAHRVLTLSHNFLYSRASQQARRYLGDHDDLIWAGALQFSSEARRLPEWYRALPGGLLFDEVPHLLYTLTSWCGPLNVAHAEASWRPDGHPHVVRAVFAGHVPAQATMVFGAPVSEWHVSLVGERRFVDLDLFRDIAVRLPSDGAHRAPDIARTSAKAIVDHGLGFAQSGMALMRGRQMWGHDVLIAAFIAAVRDHRPNPVPPSDALAVVALTEELLGSLGVDTHLGRDS